MNKKLTKILMFLAYSAPYGYLAMQGDYNSGTMMYYWLMITCLGILLWLAIKTDSITVLVIGNVLSFLFSYLLILQNQTPDWWAFFKPLSPVGLLIVITIMVFTVQALFIYLSKKEEITMNRLIETIITVLGVIIILLLDSVTNISFVFSLLIGGLFVFVGVYFSRAMQSEKSPDENNE